MNHTFVSHFNTALPINHTDIPPTIQKIPVTAFCVLKKRSITFYAHYIDTTKSKHDKTTGGQQTQERWHYCHSSAGKENTTVVMDTSTYQSKTDNILSGDNYRRIRKDPTKKLERELSEWLKHLEFISELPPGLRKRLNPSHSYIPQLYGLPKVHKWKLMCWPWYRSIPQYHQGQVFLTVLHHHEWQDTLVLFPCRLWCHRHLSTTN